MQDLAELSFNISVLHLIMDVPKEAKVKEQKAYSVHFDPDLSCTHADWRKRGWSAVVYARTGCYFAAPPEPQTCGACDYTDTNTFLQRRNVTLEWKVWINEREPVLRTTTTSHVSIPIDLSVATATLESGFTMWPALDAVFDRFDQFPVLDRSTVYAPSNGINVRFNAPLLGDLVSLEAQSPGINASVQKALSKIDRSVSRTEWIVVINDSPEFKTAAAMNLSIVSEYGDCLPSTLVARAPGEPVLPKVLDMVDPIMHTNTNVFHLDLDFFRKFLQTGDRNSRNLRLGSQVNCSLISSEATGIAGAWNFVVVIRLRSDPMVEIVPHLKNQQLHWEVDQCLGAELCRNVYIANASLDDAEPLSLTFLSGSCSVVRIRQVPEEGKEIKELPLTKAGTCAGPLQHARE
eukprot:Skav206516  [mRNA]  locus=scaffold2251:293926:295140:- [translate_table: standard]